MYKDVDFVFIFLSNIIQSCCISTHGTLSTVFVKRKMDSKQRHL